VAGEHLSLKGPQGGGQGEPLTLGDQVRSNRPFDTGCLPLSYGGNPGVNGVSDRGWVVRCCRSCRRRVRWRCSRSRCADCVWQLNPILQIVLAYGAWTSVQLSTRACLYHITASDITFGTVHIQTTPPMQDSLTAIDRRVHASLCVMQGRRKKKRRPKSVRERHWEPLRTTAPVCLMLLYDR